MKDSFVKVALIQAKYRGSKDEMNGHIVKKIEEASKNGAELIVLQELHQSEYFCQCEDTKFFDYARDFQKDVEFWAEVAKDFGVVLVTSLFEERTAGLYHNTAVVFDKDGSVAGKYRKMHIPDDPSFYEKFYFTVGDLGFEPIDTSLGRLGVLICWDQWYPESARIMALKGAEVLIYPTAIGWFRSDSKDEQKKQLNSWLTIQQSHAVANAIPVVSCNRVGFEADSSGVGEGIDFWGNSFICDERGEIIKRASSDQEEILYANLERENTKKTRDIWPFFRDRRIDAYSDILKRFCD
jgi:N-carbamoylputrescine amidase